MLCIFNEYFKPATATCDRTPVLECKGCPVRKAIHQEVRKILAERLTQNQCVQQTPTKDRRY